MIAWRIQKSRYSPAAVISGDGARLAGGRWNHKGIRVVYAADSLALATLELFVNLQEDGRHIAFTSYELEIPDSVKVFRAREEDLPHGWRASPPLKSTQDYGTAWARERKTAAMSVPSAVSPADRNLLLNPEHPDFLKVKIVSRKPFRLDPRLWK